MERRREKEKECHLSRNLIEIPIIRHHYHHINRLIARSSSSFVDEISHLNLVPCRRSIYPLMPKLFFAGTILCSHTFSIHTEFVTSSRLKANPTIAKEIEGAFGFTASTAHQKKLVAPYQNFPLHRPGCYFQEIEKRYHCVLERLMDLSKDLHLLLFAKMRASSFTSLIGVIDRWY